jgi:hypothetical protein
MTRPRKKRISQLFYNRFCSTIPWRSAEEQVWLDAVPVGREFGSPDYDRFEQLDRHAFDAFSGDMCAANQWLAQPHPALGGISPNACASSDTQLQKALDVLAERKSKAAV